MNLKSKAITSMLLLACVFHFCAGNVNIKDISNKLGVDVRKLRNEEMGFFFSEKSFHNLNAVPTELNPVPAHLQQMVEKLENKINKVFSGMDDAITILSGLSSNEKEPSSALLPCGKEKSVVVGANLMNNSNISIALGSKYLLYQMRKNITKYTPLSNAIKQEYIISEEDLMDPQYSPFSECLGHDETIIWKNYMSHQNYFRKNIVLLLDHGGSLSKKQLHISKSIAKQMLGSLSENDQVALVAVASNWSLPDRDCSDNKVESSICMESAKPSYLLKLNNFIDSLGKGSGATNHAMGIKKALEVVSKTPNLAADDITVIIYVSRGLLSSLTEARRVLTVMAEQTNFLHFTIYIHTCAVIDEMKSVMYETHFLRDVADQNYMKHNISHTTNHFRKPGYMMTVNKTDDIGFVINTFFSIFNSHSAFNANSSISLPYWDLQSGDFTVSFTRGHTSESTESFTMIGADVYFSNMVEDVTYYSSDQQYSYAFLIDLEGRVLVHPSILRPSVISHQLSFVDFKYIEIVPDIDFLRHLLLSEYKGNHVTKNNMGEELQYTWMRVWQWYVLAIVINRGYHNVNVPFKAAPNPSVKKLLYQNLDGSENHKLCRHLSQIATLDVASLYLSRSCFQSPFSASRTTQGGLVDQGYLAYLKDDTGLLTNPGLKREVRHEVAALGHILDFLRKKHLSSEMSKYIVRRYAASYSGVLQMFPGSVLTNGLEITKRPWFLRALQHQNKTIFIPPYLDKGGAGYIVTIAYATPQFVVAMDLTYGYILKMLLRYMPYCLNDKITCFLIDEQGYIIYHRNLTDLNGSRPVEQQHIVHRESLVANDILNHKQFIRKLLCYDYGDNKIQRYYRINTSFTDDLVNHVPGEQCVTYNITSVPDTNVFVGVVNASCDVVPAFCPCSIIGRLCLNCNRMEQKDCECPCECPLEPEATSCHSNDSNQNVSIRLPCKWNAEEAVSDDAHFSMDLDSSLEPCFPFNCQAERSIFDCVGVLGCEWCRYDMNGDLLKNPFCSTITSCFSGVYGLSNPYRSNGQELSPTNDSEYSPLGPILGLITAMFILFILLYICYRSYTNPPVNGLYLSTTQNQLRLSDLNVNEVFHDSGNHRDKLLTEDCLTHSPYCVAGNYKRNNTAADSDHGYSTMTPHDESEHLSLAPMEIDSLDDDVMSDNASMSTSVSAKNHSSHVVSPMFTKIPQRNCIIVPVTVHRNMDATENRSLCLS